MDLDKLIAGATKLGVVPALLAWFAYEFHTYFAQLVAQNATIIQLLEELVRLH